MNPAPKTLALGWLDASIASNDRSCDGKSPRKRPEPQPIVEP